MKKPTVYYKVTKGYDVMYELEYSTREQAREAKRRRSKNGDAHWKIYKVITQEVR